MLWLRVCVSIWCFGDLLFGFVIFLSLLMMIIQHGQNYNSLVLYVFIFLFFAVNWCHRTRTNKTKNTKLVNDVRYDDSPKICGKIAGYGLMLKGCLKIGVFICETRSFHTNHFFFFFKH